MTMRAPPLASMAAVAAPRPDAEPVTIAHNPSFDIRISSSDLELASRDAPYRAPKCLQIGKTPLRGINRCGARSLHVAFAGALADNGACHGSGFSPSCGARKDRSRCLGAKRNVCGLKKRGTLWRRVRTLSP